MSPIRVATRASRLALAQSAIAADALRPVVGDVEIVALSTRGDTISARQPRGSWVATDGQFTRDLERALLEGSVDLVVHSYKDLPTDPVPGLVIGAVLARADPRDCLLTRDGGGLDDLPFGGRIGTSSPRRAAQLAATRNDLVAMPIRGNVDSRLRRLAAGELDGLLLAAAGLDRLGVEIPLRARLPLDLMLPAPAQGALALQVREDDARLRSLIELVEHRPSRIAADAERALLRRVGGGCLAPLGALAEVDGAHLRLRAAYEDPDGSYVRADEHGPVDAAAALVEIVATRIERALAPA